jgi:regulator of replication initiation timing
MLSPTWNDCSFEQQDLLLNSPNENVFICDFANSNDINAEGVMNTLVPAFEDEEVVRETRNDEFSFTPSRCPSFSTSPESGGREQQEKVKGKRRGGSRKAANAREKDEKGSALQRKARIPVSLGPFESPLLPCEDEISALSLKDFSKYWEDRFQYIKSDQQKLSFIHRRIMNRESASAARGKKRALTKTLQSENEALLHENEELKKKLMKIEEGQSEMVEQNNELKAHVENLYNEGKCKGVFSPKVEETSRALGLAPLQIAGEEKEKERENMELHPLQQQTQTNHMELSSPEFFGNAATRFSVLSIFAICALGLCGPSTSPPPPLSHANFTPPTDGPFDSSQSHPSVIVKTSSRLYSVTPTTAHTKFSTRVVMFTNRTLFSASSLLTLILSDPKASPAFEKETLNGNENKFSFMEQLILTFAFPFVLESFLSTLVSKNTVLRKEKKPFSLILTTGS